MSKVMSINAGSSSLKFQLFEMPEEKVLVSGLIERIGFEDAYFTTKFNGNKEKQVLPIKDHSVAVSCLLNKLVELKVVKDLSEIKGVGHRVVQGGNLFSESTKVIEGTIDTLRTISDLAPLHNPAAIIGYEAFAAALPEAGHVLVFDTAFHSKMPAVSYMYATPYEWYEKYAVRKYGAHGTSHEFVSQEAIKYLNLGKNSKVITCHIGNGASISAVLDGQCLDTSMGFTPLAGVMMGTRTGDIDPAVVTYVMKKTGMSAEEVLNSFNKKSGLLGVSGISSDSRDVEDAANAGNERAILAQDMQIRSIVRTVGAYYAELGGCDAIIFTAGLGENNIALREAVCKQLEGSMGVKIDAELNNCRGEFKVISADDSKVKVMVIPTNEELVIARDTNRILGL